MLALMNPFTFLTKKAHENLSNTLIVTKFIRCIFPMFNNKAFLDLIDKLSWQIYTKSRKHKNQKTQRVAKPQQYLWQYFVKASQ